MYCILDAFFEQILDKISVAKKPQKVVLFSSTKVLLFARLKSSTFIVTVQNRPNGFYRQMQNYGNQCLRVQIVYLRACA